MQVPSGTARRLSLALAALVSLFVVSSLLALVHMREIHSRLVEMQARQHAVRSALEVASAIRDTYAHQAHTLILGNDSHLHFYETAAGRVTRLTEEMKAQALGPEERAWVEDIERAQRALDTLFREALLPAVLAGRQEDMEREHGRALGLVSQMEERTDRLVSHFNRSVDAAEARVAELQSSAFQWTLFFLVGAPLLAIGVGVYIVRSVARPVARLREGAARLAAGDMHARIDISTPDEFGELARQFNAMTAALREHQEQLVQSEKLAGIGRLAAGVAHEINNPLTVILGYAGMMKKKVEGSLREDLQVIEDEAVRSRNIVQDLLALSRPLQAEPEPVDLRALCEDVVERLRQGGQLSAVRVDVEGEARTAGHLTKLRQVVLNLVRNAVDACGEQGRVRVRLAQTETGAELHVEDTGPGLSATARERLFEPFFTTKPSGTGLGLAISQSIVQAHGGNLEAAAGTGPGAHFTVWLPATLPGRA
ncbi:sensor histidine kinase [Archangium lansingense]|uniref:histidine kinase n=1 Tax=Archangium lansingense TaxID=2995310 RepID=A0ABT4ABZ3_9BACT|nr:ATP-binding protein [Archangium lansinium]MCY1079182.1 ATP-binding protein [Archangium lansinium]